MKMRLSSFAVSILGLCLVSRISGSAIPIWEYLTRDEKMSHLYKIFSQQVEKYCSRSSMPDCNKNFLVTGMQKLASISNDRLDLLDPYQRDSEDMIWRALAGGSRKNEQEGDDRYSGIPDYTESGNELAEESARVEDYIRPADHPGPFLVGPMVFRVMPDGRPVPGDSQGPLPKDEDIDELRYPHVPSIQEIETKTNSRFYQKPEQPFNNALGSPLQERRRPQPSYHFYIRGRPYNYPLRERSYSGISRETRYY